MLGLRLCRGRGGEALNLVTTCRLNARNLTPTREHPRAASIGTMSSDRGLGQGEALDRRPISRTTNCRPSVPKEGWWCRRTVPPIPIDRWEEDHSNGNPKKQTGPGRRSVDPDLTPGALNPEWVLAPSRTTGRVARVVPDPDATILFDRRRDRQGSQIPRTTPTCRGLQARHRRFNGDVLSGLFRDP